MPQPAGHTLRLTRCPRCRYDISSLPRRHKCPECGYAYDEKMFMLEGWRLPGGGWWVRRLFVYGPVAFVVIGWMRWEMGWSWRVLLALAAIAAGGVLAVYLVARRRDASGHRALARFLITEDGVSRPGGGIYLWRNYSHVMLLEEGRGAWRIHIYPSWWRLVGPPIVNARLECTDSEAESVRAEIQRRINAALSAAAAEERPRQRPARRWW